MNVSACLVTKGARGPGRKSLIDRIMEKISLPAEPDGCWIWTGAQAGRQGARYGRVFAGNRTAAGHPRPEQAHRVIYECCVGKIPDGLEIDHVCRVTLCVNPDHLEAVPPLENQRRGNSPMQAQRKQTRCKRGHLLDEENTYVWHGMRRCRACQADDARRYRAKKTT